mmetsp:Transcript_33227/g.95571  ORF Transcript_33227/g.95571 Transcript_33227/m.95571 type:complete len:218 (-) Transcript_33227:126-779(-)
MSRPSRISAHMGSRPCSSIWSASSSMMVWTNESDSLPQSIMSINRPGVAHRMSTWLLAIFCCCSFMLSPPYTTRLERLLPFVITSISLDVWMANSRVGDSIKQIGLPCAMSPGKKGLAVAPCASKRATVGITKAKVLPEPVCAEAIRSKWPSSWLITGMAWRWISVGRSRPAACSLSSTDLSMYPLLTASSQEEIGSGRPSGSLRTGRSSMLERAPA